MGQTEPVWFWSKLTRVGGDMGFETTTALGLVSTLASKVYWRRHFNKSNRCWAMEGS
jgi:hypothetical protein